MLNYRGAPYYDLSKLDYRLYVLMHESNKYKRLRLITDELWFQTLLAYAIFTGKSGETKNEELRKDMN